MILKTIAGQQLHNYNITQTYLPYDQHQIAEFQGVIQETYLKITAPIKRKR